MAITRVQETRNATGTNNTTSCAVTVSSTGSGNLILVVYCTGSGSAPAHSAPTDASNTYTQVGTTVVNGNVELSVWKTLSSISGITTITGHIASAPGSFFDCYVAEYSGGPWTQNNTAQGTGGSTTASSGNVTRLTGDLLFGAALTPATSATNLANLVDTTDGNGIGDTLGAANNTTAAMTFTTTTGAWCCLGVSFTPGSAIKVPFYFPTQGPSYAI